MLLLSGMELGDRQIISLGALQQRIRASLAKDFAGTQWVRAEVSECKVNPAGHCYLTLVEKEAEGALCARASAIVWASSWRLIGPYFERETGQSLSSGMSILVQAQVQYSELYGLSLIITDIDPSFSVGELERARRRTLLRLEEEGMLDLNGRLPLKALPRRFAVITSETAAGWRDFRRHLHENEYGFRFGTTLFQATMQGSEAPGSIIAALDAVAAREAEFDAVLILRGGGGASDLICYDDYELAVNVAQFPLPVLTGIGHDHDRHIIDEVAHTSVKTPTALADYLIDLFASADYELASLSTRLRLALESKMARSQGQLDALLIRLKGALSMRYTMEQQRLETLRLRIAAADPAAQLERGGALVLREGVRAASAAEFAPGDRLTAVFSDGSLEATVLSKEMKNH